MKRLQTYIKLVSTLLLTAVCFLIISVTENINTTKNYVREFLQEERIHFHQSLFSVIQRTQRTTPTTVSSHYQATNFTPLVSRKPVTRPKYPLTINGNYKIKNPDICENKSNKRIDCLILVHTSTVHISRRNRMRSGWGNSTAYLPFQMRMVFLLGTTNNKKVQKLIEHENEIYGDIVQGDFLDSYRNLTNKGVMGLRWVTEFCKNVSIVAKVDDDVFLNLFELIEKHIEKYTQHKRQIFCNYIPKNSMAIIRDKNSKWYVKKDEFRNLTRYPFPYCSGFAVLLSGDLIPVLYSAAATTPFFWVDDFYLFGLLPSRIANVTYNPLKKGITLRKETVWDCVKQIKPPCNILAMPLVTPTLLWKYVLSHRNTTYFNSTNPVSR